MATALTPEDKEYWLQLGSPSSPQASEEPAEEVESADYWRNLGKPEQTQATIDDPVHTPQVPSVNRKDHYILRAEDAFNRGREKVSDAWNKERVVSPNVPQEYRDAFGETAPASMMERVQGVASGALESLAAPITPVIEDIVQSKPAKWLMENHPVVQGVKRHPLAPKILEAGADVLSRIPEDEAGQLSDAFNVAAMAGPSVFKGAKKLPGLKGRANQAQAAGPRSRKDLLEELMLPDQGYAHGSIRQHPNGRNYYSPSKGEQDMFDTVTKVRGMDPKKGYAYNAGVLDDTVKGLADDLDASLAKLKPVSANRVLIDMQDNLDELLENMPTMVGDARESADKVVRLYIKHAKKYVKKGGTISPEDLLKARRELDSETASLIRSAIGSNSSNGTHEAVLAVRREINKALADMGADTDVMESLAKQHHMLRARDTMDDRAWSEGVTTFSRWLEGVERASGVSHPTTPLALGATVGSKVGLMSTAGTLGYGALKMSKRQFMSKYYRVLGAIEEVIKKGGKAAEAAKADRLAIVSLKEQLEQEHKENSN
jgi:hypothetical protein